MNLYVGWTGHNCTGETHRGCKDEHHATRKATIGEALQYALTCRTCGGSGEVDTHTADTATGTSMRDLHPTSCPDCVDRIPRWAVETVAHSLHQHGDRLDAYGNMGPQTGRWQDCAGADAHEGAAVNLLVALRDRKETE